MEKAVKRTMGSTLHTSPATWRISRHLSSWSRLREHRQTIPPFASPCRCLRATRVRHCPHGERRRRLTRRLRPRAPTSLVFRRQAQQGIMALFPRAVQEASSRHAHVECTSSPIDAPRATMRATTLGMGRRLDPRVSKRQQGLQPRHPQHHPQGGRRNRRARAYRVEMHVSFVRARSDRSDARDRERRAKRSMIRITSRNGRSHNSTRKTQKDV